MHVIGSLFAHYSFVQTYGREQDFGKRKHIASGRVLKILNIQTSKPQYVVEKLKTVFEKLRDVAEKRCRSLMYFRQDLMEKELLFEARAQSGERLFLYGAEKAESLSLSPANEETDEPESSGVKTRTEKKSLQTQLGSLLQSNIAQVWTFINVSAVESNKNEVSLPISSNQR